MPRREQETILLFDPKIGKNC